MCLELSVSLTKITCVHLRSVEQENATGKLALSTSTDKYFFKVKSDQLKQAAAKRSCYSYRYPRYYLCDPNMFFTFSFVAKQRNTTIFSIIKSFLKRKSNESKILGASQILREIW